MIDIATHTKNTVKNLKTAIEKFKNKANLQLLEDFVNAGKFERKVLLLGGGQIQGSLSPFMHTLNAVLDKKEFLYTLINLEKENIEIKDLLNRIEQTENILGANVTMPYKIDVFNILEKDNKLDDSAILVGAVNTIAKIDNKIKGFNTDMEGIKIPLEETLENDIKKIETAYVFGAGGAARAAVSALLALGITNIKVLNRSIKGDFIDHFSSEKVKKILKNQYNVSSPINIEMIKYDVTKNPEILSEIVDKKGIFINTSPFGFKEKLPQKCLTDEEFEKIKDKIALFFDVVYDMNYKNTPLLDMVEEQNIKTCDGKDMVINQAVRGFELWTNGGKFDKELITKIFK